MIKGKIVIRKISAEVTDSELKLMMAYIKGMVYGHTIENSKQWFSGTILFGGKNRDWNGTPVGSERLLLRQCNYKH